MLMSIDLFRKGATMACTKDDGKVDPNERKALKRLEKDLDALEKTIRWIVNE